MSLSGPVLIRVREARQLFNSMDPSPFRERDLDRDCEQFILDWARELPADGPIEIEVHLEPEHATEETHALLREAIRTHFAREVDVVTARLKLAVREGRRALLVGLLFLAVCNTIANALSGEGHLGATVSEGLAIAGWVAMWRPMEVFLYDLWPLRRERRLFRRLAVAGVDVVATPHPQPVSA